MKRFITFLFVVIFQPVISQSTWVEAYNANSLGFPSKTCFVDEGHIWGIKNGAIYFSNNGGQSWNLQYMKPEFNFSDVFFVNETEGWVVGWSEVLHTSNGGESWGMQTLPNPLGLDVNTVYFINPDTGWIAGSYKTIFVTHNGGENWLVQQPYQLEGHYWLYEIRFWDELQGCAVGGKLLGGDTGIIYNTHDGGDTWISNLPDAAQEFNSVQYIDQDTIWAGDRAGILYRSTDGGLSWEFEVLLYGMGSPHLTDFHFFNHNRAMAILGPWEIAKTENAWQDYKIENLGLYHRFCYLSYNEPHEGIASGFGDFWMTLDTGTTWNYQNEKFYCLDFPEAGSGWMSSISPDNGFYQTMTGGSNWQQVPSPDGSPVLSIDFLTVDQGFISTESGLFRTTDGGVTWENISIPSGVTKIFKIQVIDPDTLYALTVEKKLLKTTNAAQTWEIIDEFESHYLTDLHFLSGQWGSLVGALGFTATTNDGGISWDFTMLEDVHPVAIWYLNTNEGIIATFSGSLYQTQDGGFNWNPGTLVTPRPVEMEFATDNIGWIAEWQKIHKTEDGGETWEMEFTLQGLGMNEFITDLSVVDEQTAYFCTSGGRVFYYDFLSDNNNNQDVMKSHCFPNPATSVTQISASEPFTGKEQLFLFDMAGNRVNNVICYFRSGKTMLDVSGLKEGLYVYSLIKNNSIYFSGKLIVK